MSVTSSEARSASISDGGSHVTWEPPAEIDADLASLLDTLI